MTQEPCFCLTIIPLSRSVVNGSVIHAIFLCYSEEITCKFHKKQRSVIKDANDANDAIYVFFLLACLARHALNPRISCKLSWNLPFRKKVTRVWFLNLVEKMNSKLYKKTAGIRCDKAEALFLSRHGRWLENETNRRHNTDDTLEPYNNSSYRSYQRF